MPKIEQVWLAEPMREGEYPDGACVGHSGVTEIIERDEFQGDHSIKWFDVFSGDKLVKKFGKVAERDTNALSRSIEHIEVIMIELKGMLK